MRAVPRNREGARSLRLAPFAQVELSLPRERSSICVCDMYNENTTRVTRGRMDKSSNPALSNKAFARFGAAEATDTMTVGGTLLKAGLAFLVLIAAALWGWALTPQFGVTIPWWTLWVGIGASIVVGIWAVFQANVFTVLLYSALEGAYLGIISRFFETAYDGIIVQAILLTLTITLGMFFLFATGAVKVTKKFRSVMLIATLGIFLYIVAEFLLALFIPGFANLVFSGPLGIVIALVIVLIAALNLLLDFDTIRQGVANKLSRKAEWYAAFGLMVTLIWLYISILRLLGATRR